MSMVRRVSSLAATLALASIVACGGAQAPSAAVVPAPAASSPDGGTNASTAVAIWSDAESPVTVSSADPSWGRRDALVTLVVFSDFQCPFCERVERVFSRLKEAYGPEKLRIVWKNEPLVFHANAKPAALAAEAAFRLGGAEAFWKFHDQAFRGQRDLSPANFERWAVAAGVDLAAFRKELEAPAVAAKVSEDERLAQAVGAVGTPMSFVNGVEVSGAQPFEEFQRVIDEELRKAQAKLASGTAKDRLYVTLSKENFKAPSVRAEEEQEEEDKPDTTVWKAIVGTSPVRGRADAPVTIVEFSDFQCPFCARVEPTLAKVRETYGDKVRIVWKDEPLPFHDRAIPAAELARYARSQKGDTGFWSVHDKLFASQPKLDDEALLSVAKAAGLDPKKALAAIQARAHKKEIQADSELADDLKANGTPHFFVNGRRLVGAQPFEKFKGLIDEELKKFDDQKGKVAAKDYYETLMKTAQGAPEPEKRSAPKVTSSSPFKGGANAKVVIQEWSDFQCPFCSRVEPTVAEILANYGDKVKIVWRDQPLPFHVHARSAALAAREAFAQKGNVGFWQMHDKIFANQAKLERADLEGYAQEIGLDMAKFKAALDTETHKGDVETDAALGSAIGLGGTPSFLINDYVLTGAQPYANFKKLIDRALGETKAPKK